MDRIKGHDWGGDDSELTSEAPCDRPECNPYAQGNTLKQA